MVNPRKDRDSQSSELCCPLRSGLAEESDPECSRGALYCACEVPVLHMVRRSIGLHELKIGENDADARTRLSAVGLMCRTLRLATELAGDHLDDSRAQSARFLFFMLPSYSIIRHLENRCSA
jgi:hypothetical protein